MNNFHFDRIEVLFFIIPVLLGFMLLASAVGIFSSKGPFYKKKDFYVALFSLLALCIWSWVAVNATFHPPYRQGPGIQPPGVTNY